MKNILLFGAGKSATVLIEFLKTITDERKWMATIVDASFEVVTSKTDNHKRLKPIQIDIEDELKRKKLINKADIVISLMPPHLHYLIALDCITYKKNLLTASYIDEQTKLLATQVKENGLLFLYEMGLDPGIDHMSAMKLIHHIKQEGGEITKFYSHCGGLVAPESDDNPWHYKISWNPRNVVMAGKAGAIFKQNNVEVTLQYEQLFEKIHTTTTPQNITFAYYPNRDSLSYVETYQLQHATDFVRTTLRHPDFMFGWKNIIDLKLTNEDKIYETNGLSLAAFFKMHLNKNGFSKWLDDMLMTKLSSAKETMEKIMELLEAEEEAIEKGDLPSQEVMMVDEKGFLNTIDVEDIKETAAEAVATSMNEANLSMKQLFYLGMGDDETIINKGLCSAADVLQFALEQKISLAPNDLDMIVMLHEISFTNKSNATKIYKSYLQVKGTNNANTAMAKTVGLPLGIAAVLILDNQISDTGLHIPILPSIYNPVLKVLETHGITFDEKEEEA